MWRANPTHYPPGGENLYIEIARGGSSPKAIGVIVLTRREHREGVRGPRGHPEDERPVARRRGGRSPGSTSSDCRRWSLPPAIPVDRVRGRDPTPWRCTSPAHAWRLWWGALAPLGRKEKKREECTPPRYQPKPDDVCPRLSLQVCRFLFADRGCTSTLGGVRPRDRHP